MEKKVLIKGNNSIVKSGETDFMYENDDLPCVLITVPEVCMFDPSNGVHYLDQLWSVTKKAPGWLFGALIYLD